MQCNDPDSRLTGSWCFIYDVRRRSPGKELAKMPSHKLGDRAKLFFEPPITHFPVKLETF